ncbi:MAG: alpha/beta hydrolase [Acidobacteria bacterium]|nr:alpha/beta hydrolase [Acidobacteriota bacterium]
MQEITRRGMMKWSLLSTGLSLLPTGRLSSAFAQVGGRAEEQLFEGKNLAGGGQLDVRLAVTPFTDDPDELEIWERMRAYDMDSWVTEYTRVAEKNEKRAEGFEKEGLTITANEYYLRAARFYQTACWPQPESDPRMMPTFNKMWDVAKRAYKLVPPPFETVEIPYEGSTLPAYFSKPRGTPGQRFPVVYTYGGADSVSYGGGGGAYVPRGMASLTVDGPGQGLPLRVKHIYAPPDSERVAKAVIDYLVSRPDVDPNRIGIVGSSMAGYAAPRCASGEKRIKACAFSSGAYSLLEDIFEYFPPIQERVRWLIGAKDMADARKKIAEFTLEGRADKIECPMLIGYSKDDRVMDPQGAFRIYQAAVNSKRIMVEGIGHNHPSRVGGPRPQRPPVIADWMAQQLVGGGVSS